MNTVKRTRRQANLEATRAQVVQAAGRLFVEKGYAGTTLVEIADEAGVAVQTIYNAVGSKSAVLTAVFEALAAGPGSPRSVPEMMRERTAAVPGSAGVIQVLGEWFCEVHPRMEPFWSMLDQAAGQDPDVARLARDSRLRRLKNYELEAAELQRRGATLAGMDVEGAAAVIWSIGHPNVYRTLVSERGWTPERYRDWVVTALSAALIST